MPKRTNMDESEECKEAVSAFLDGLLTLAQHQRDEHEQSGSLLYISLGLMVDFMKPRLMMKLGTYLSLRMEEQGYHRAEYRLSEEDTQKFVSELMGRVAIEALSRNPSDEDEDEEEDAHTKGKILPLRPNGKGSKGRLH